MKQKRRKIKEPFDFSTALSLMKKGMPVYRKGWNGIQLGKDMYVVLSSPLNSPGLFSEPYFKFIEEMESDDPISDWKTWIGWMPSIMDILANDWYVYEAEWVSFGGFIEEDEA